MSGAIFDYPFRAWGLKNILLSRGGAPGFNTFAPLGLVFLRHSNIQKPWRGGISEPRAPPGVAKNNQDKALKGRGKTGPIKDMDDKTLQSIVKRSTEVKILFFLSLASSLALTNAINKFILLLKLHHLLSKIKKWKYLKSRKKRWN